MTPRAIRWLPLAAVLAGGACFHTQQVGAPKPEGEHGGESANSESPKKEEGSSGRITKGRVPPRDGRPAVSASPEGLMNPGSAAKIQDALASRRYLASKSGELDTATSAALRRFQEDQGLAPTGAPDRETLKRLGIDPGDVYRTGQPQPSSRE